MIRRRLAATGGVELSVCDWQDELAPGAGVPFLLVHGLASNARLWDGVARELAHAGHPCVAVDQRGHGLSDKPDHGYDSATVCADLGALLDGLGWDRSVVVGQSWGGNVVVELAARVPQRLAGVCGVDGGTLRLAARFGTWEDCKAALTPPPLTGLLATDLRRRMEIFHPDWPAEGIDGAMACFEVRADGTVAPWLTMDHHLAILAGMYADDPARLYADIGVPTLFIPAADPGNPGWTAGKRADVDEAIRALPKGRAVWFDPADHDVHAQHPVDVARVLLGQLADGFFPVKRILAIMGSGETAPTMTKVHRVLFERMGPGPVPAVLLDTPFGFQANADELTERTVAYFRESVDRPLGVASFRRAATADPLAVERLRLQLRDAALVFAGPGSPSYALRQWAGSPVPGALAEKLRDGGCVTFSSAAALTLGVATVPVYEVYKVGADPEWLPGLGLTAATGLPMAVVPHYDNAEGGTHDTRFCYLGEGRLRMLEADLDDATFVFGVDEHTAAVFDLDASTLEVLGRGVVTVRVDGRSEVIPSGAVVAVDAIRALAERLRHGAPSEVVAAHVPTAVADGPPAPAHSLMESIAAYQADFEAALAGRDAAGAVRCALALEDELHAWSADTLQSDEMDRGRAVLRGMLVRLGAAAEEGVRDPRDVAEPWVEALLALRASARQAKRWADADDIRDRLVALGVEVRDDPSGTDWSLA